MSISLPWLLFARLLLFTFAAAPLFAQQAAAAGQPRENEALVRAATLSRDRPNIIVLLADDLNAGDLGVAGHPWLKTPHLDALAAQGTYFQRAFVTTALCSPSRASILTGRYARHHRILSNVEPFGPDHRTFATLLSKKGYATAYIGKWHMGNNGDPRPGFGYTASYGGHGKVRDSPFIVGTDSTELVETKGWVDDVATDYAIDYLRRSRTRPLLLFLGFKAPHTPRIPDERHAGLYTDVEMPPPAVPKRFPPYPTKPEYQKLAAASGEQGARYRPSTGWLEDWDGPRLPDTELKAGTGQGEDLRNYYRLVSGLDENVGRLMATLRELKLDRNTLVVFTSDNGLMNGYLGVYGKRSPYEEALAVPLLVRLPPSYGGVPRGRVSEDLVLNIDIAPTLLDYAGCDVPEDVSGRSLRPLLDIIEPAGSESPPWRDRFVAEFEPSFPGRFPSVLALRTKDWKLITYPDHPAWTELFDLRSDPREATDLAQDPNYGETLGILRRSLAEEVALIGPPAASSAGRGQAR